MQVNENSAHSSPVIHGHDGFCQQKVSEAYRLEPCHVWPSQEK